MPAINGIPPIGLGTWLRTGAAGFEAIMTAIELGYRHLDTAQTYDTEANVGRAVRECGLPRDDLFVVTKIADVNLARSKFMPSLRRSLDTLGLDRVDLALIHWPSHDAVPLADYMQSLAAAKADGLTRMIGVSNFTIPLIEQSVAVLGAGALVTNQVEMHPYLQGRRLAAACARHGIAITAYMPLAKGRVAHDRVIAPIGAAHGVSAATATLAWLLAKGMIAIPASHRPEHLAANLAAADVTLSANELAAIDALDRGDRMIDPPKAPTWDDPP